MEMDRKDKVTMPNIFIFKQLDFSFIKGILIEKLLILNQVGSLNEWEIRYLNEQIKLLELWQMNEKEF